jgi:hypothetical protein
MLLVLETHQVIHIELSFFDKLDFFNFLNVFVNLKDIGWVYCLNRLGVTIKVIIDDLHPIIISFTLNTSSYARSDTPWASLHEWATITASIVIDNDILVRQAIKCKAFRLSIRLVEAWLIVALIAYVLLGLVLDEPPILSIALFVHLAFFDHRKLILWTEHALLTVWWVATAASRLGRPTHRSNSTLLFANVAWHFAKLLWMDQRICVIELVEVIAQRH